MTQEETVRIQENLLARNERCKHPKKCSIA